MLRERDGRCRGTPTVLSVAILFGAIVMGVGALVVALNAELSYTVRTWCAVVNASAFVTLCLASMPRVRHAHNVAWPLISIGFSVFMSIGVSATSHHRNDTSATARNTAGQGMLFVFYLVSCVAIATDSSRFVRNTSSMQQSV
jgi:hypothetical protein